LSVIIRGDVSCGEGAESCARRSGCGFPFLGVWIHGLNRQTVKNQGDCLKTVVLGLLRIQQAITIHQNPHQRHARPYRSTCSLNNRTLAGREKFSSPGTQI